MSRDTVASTDRSARPGDRPPVRTDGGTQPSSRFTAAVLGALLSFFVGWVPFLGPIAGGVLAGYLRGEDTKESAITGSIANFLASLPSLGIAALFLSLGVLGAATSSDGGGSELAVGLAAWLLIFAVSFLYYWAFGAIGGVLGAAMSDRGYPA